MLVATEMSEYIISQMRDGTDNAVKANKKFGDAVIAYLCENIVIQCAWAAANPSGTADPMVTFTGTVTGEGTLTPSDSFQEMLLKLAVLIKALTITAPAGFLLSGVSFNPAGVLTVQMTGETTQGQAMANFCAQIIKSIKETFPNPAPATGTHGAFAGATTKMVIT
jgi:hypothetical protein